MFEAAKHTLIFTGMMATVFGSFAASYLAFRRLLLKGWPPFGAGLLVLAVYTPTFAYGIHLAAAESPALLLPFSLPCIAVLTLLGLPSLSDRRRAGPRKTHFPFRFVGAIAFALAAASVIDYFISPGWSGFDSMFKIAVALAAVGGYLFWLHERSRALGLEHAIATDERQHVLFLRSFKRDLDFFLPEAPDDLRHLSGNWGDKILRLSAFTSPTTNPSLSLEEFFVEEIQTEIGPFVALGSPEDYLPPVGAARTYARDEDWTLRLADLASRAALIVMEPDESRNLAWELEYIRSNGLQRKLIVVLKPHAAHLTKWSFLHWTFKYMRWARGIRETTWPAFVASMRGYGYSMDSTAPAPGSVFAFDEHASAVLLTSDARYPADYVEPMAKWATLGIAVGRNTTVPCARCRANCFVQDEQQTLLPVVCLPCREYIVYAGLDTMRRFGKRIGKFPMLMWAWLACGLGLYFLCAQLFWYLKPWLPPSETIPIWLIIAFLFGVPILFCTLPIWWPRSRKKAA